MKKLLFVFLTIALCGAANAAVLKLATVAPEGSQWMKDMRASAAEIKEKTDGRVQIKYYGGGVMGNDTKVLGRIRIGALQGGAFTPTALASQYPDLNLYDTCHPVVRHPKMSAEEWSRAFRDASTRFYRYENVKAILARAHPRAHSHCFKALLWYRQAALVQHAHPLVSGFWRRRGCS